MDKGLINKFIAWSLITFGSTVTMGFIIALSEGAQMGALFGLGIVGLIPTIGGINILRNTNRRIKRLKQNKCEREILKLVSKNEGRITVHEIAMNTPLSMTDAKDQLEKMQKHGEIDMEVSETGSVIYTFPALLPNGKKKNENF